MAGVIKVKNMYSTSFEELYNFPSPVKYGIPNELIVNDSTPRYYNPTDLVCDISEASVRRYVDSLYREYIN